jgi:para-aminobenzoate synthetase / 4-amino-4-deoxychorismate lyase
MTERPAVIFDDVTVGRLTVFGHARGIIRADTPQEVVPALDALEAARRSGNFTAGYFSYEAGYALEPRLAPLMPSRPDPLLWFGVFDPPVTCDAAALQGWEKGRAYAGPLTPQWDADAYAEPFRRVRDLIAAGDFYQANLTFRARFAFAGDPLALYAKLRPASAARYGAYVDDGTRQILSLSPELFFDIAADGAITTKPMKGTAARENDPQADMLARAALAASIKNRAENLMIVDLLRNDLGRIAQLGSVAVPDLFAVETYPTLHQMVSTVSARLRPGTGIPEVVRALFPCGSVTGAPKIRAMETIAELENSPRGVYCGAIGFFAPDGSARFNVAIRTLTISGSRGELGIGGGIVQDSECAGEYAEALLKARYYETARRPLELIETLRWSAAEGFVRRDLHLARMAASAEFFGLQFDRTRALDVLDEATFALALPGQDCVSHRLRLTLDESGEIACTTARLGPTKDVWTVAISPQRVSSTDALARHKTNWREPYDIAPPSGVDELLFCNERGELVEGARTNIFVARDGVLLTPPLSAGALDGVLRRALLAEGRVVEAILMPADLSGEFYLGNSLRGLIRGRLR